MSAPGFKLVKGVALAVTDAARARQFYVETLALAPAHEGGEEIGVQLGEALLMFKSDWYGRPTDANGVIVNAKYHPHTPPTLKNARTQ